MSADEKYMRAALKEAQKAFGLDEVPIGCVIVRGDKIIARGCNRRNTDGSALAHAEMAAIRKACRKVGDWRLEDCTIYITLEPCPMCAGAIVQARMKECVIACRNPKAGCAGSVTDLLHMDGFNHQVDVRFGPLENECSELLRKFFRRIRTEKGCSGAKEEPV